MMSHKFRKAPCAWSGKLARRSWCRLQLERLEDRVVPSIADGTLLVATAPSAFATNPQPDFIGIVGVNPGNGAQTVIVGGPTGSSPFQLPTYMAEDPNTGVIYITDLQAFGTGAVWRFDPNSGSVTLLRNAGLNGPNALAFVNGFLYVANEGDGTGQIHFLAKLDPNTGALLSTIQGNFTVPTGMSAVPGQNAVYVADEQGGANSPVPPFGRVFKIDFANNNLQTIVSDSSKGPLFHHPVDLAVDASGNIIVANTGDPTNNTAGSVFRINPATGAQTLITTFAQFSGTDSVEIGVSGTIFVGAIANGSNQASVTAVNPSSGAQTILTTDDQLSLVEGMLTYRAVVQQPRATTTTLASSVNPSVFGQAVAFTATVAPTSGSGTPTGTVQFMVDGSNFGSPVTLSGGVATSNTISTLSVGSHTIAVSYSGDATFASSTRSISQVVNKASTSTVVTSSANPSGSGQSVTFTATVSVVSPGSTAAANPTGTVTFFDGTTTLGQGTASTSGGITRATFTTSSLPVGSHTISASYLGDGNFTASKSANLTQSVTNASKTATTTTLASSVNPSVFGQGVTFTATVAPSSGSGTPTGTVQFMVDGSNFGSPVTLSGGVATSTATSTLTVGSHTVTASYSGDATFASSTSSPLSQTVNKASTSTVVTSSANPSGSGQSVTFTATVSVLSPGTTAAANPTGTVTFFDGTTTLGQGTASTSGGITRATFTTSSLSVGSHTISASYLGDGNFTASKSANLTQTVSNQSKTATTTSITSSANPSTVGQNVTFTATVTTSGSGTPTGTVTFLEGSTTLGQGTLSGTGGTATATFTTSSLGAGTHTITASYGGDSTFAGSTSTALTQSVGNATTASTTTTVTSSANPQTAGQPVSWTATVAAAGAVNFVGFETGDFSQAAAHVGGAIVTSPALDGTFSLQLQRSNSTAYYEIRQSGSTYYNLPTAYYRFLFESTSNPGEGGIVNFQDNAGGFKAALHLSSANKLLFFDSNGTLRGTGTTVLASGQVYAISAKIGTGTNAAWEVRLNGNVELSGTASLGAANNGSIRLGGNATYTTNYYYDDVAINSQTYPGTVPTGTVQFVVDGKNFGSPVALSGGVATSSTTSTLSVGTHTVTANYSGDSNFASSTGTLAGGQVISGSQSSTVNFVDFETGDFSQTATHTGGAIVTSPALDGTFSLQLQRSNSVANAEIRQSGTTYYNLPTAYYSFLFEYTSNPGEGGIVNFQDTASGYKAALHLSPAEKLQFYNVTGTLLATGTTVLAAGQVYTISAKIGTGSNAAWEVHINGAVEMSGTGNLGTANNGSVKLGGNAPYTTNYYYDDVTIDSQGFPAGSAPPPGTSTGPLQVVQAQGTGTESMSLASLPATASGTQSQTVPALVPFEPLPLSAVEELTSSIAGAASRKQATGSTAALDAVFSDWSSGLPLPLSPV